MALALNSSWETLTGTEGISISRRKIADSDSYEFRGVGQVEADLAQALALLTDVSKQTLWVDGCEKAVLIERNFSKKKVPAKIQDLYQIAYGVQNVPWPLTDRDYIIYSTLKTHTEDHRQLQSVELISKAIPHDSHPESEDYVRIHQMLTTIILTPNPQGVLVDFRVQVDPGGMIPDWVVNLVTKSVPTKTILSIRELLKEKAYDPEVYAQVLKQIHRQFPKALAKEHPRQVIPFSPGKKESKRL